MNWIFSDWKCVHVSSSSFEPCFVLLAFICYGGTILCVAINPGFRCVCVFILASDFEAQPTTRPPRCDTELAWKELASRTGHLDLYRCQRSPRSVYRAERYERASTEQWYFCHDKPD